MYDVIVIGAGPAGSTAAKILAENGLSILMLERLKLPRYKSCSGCLINKSLDLVRQYFNAEVPAFVTCSPAENRGMFFTDDKGNTFSFPQPGLNVWRSGFDNWLAQMAVKSGATLWENAPALSCRQDEGSVMVKIGDEHKGEVMAKYVVDCEGVTGNFKSKLLGGHPEYITTYQTFNEGTIDLDLHYFYAYLQPEFSEYDAWFNVKDDMLVLGVSVKNPPSVPRYYTAFISYMEREYGLKITKQIKEDRWLLPRIKPGCPVDYASGRVFFAGEIAGWLNPMGEGVSCGMESAFHLSRAMIDNFGSPEKIEAAYRENAEDLRQYMLRQWRLTGKMSETFREMI